MAVWFCCSLREEIKFGPNSLRTVRVIRLDTLNLKDSTAFKPNHANWATLSLDALDEEFVYEELAVVARNWMPPNGEQRIDEASSRGKLLKHVGELVSAEIFASTKLTKDEAAQIDAKINERNDWIRRTSFDTEFWRRSQRQFVLPRDVVHALRAADDPIGRHILGVDDDLKAFRANELAVVAMIGDFVQEEFIVSVLEEDRLKTCQSICSKSKKSTSPRYARWCPLNSQSSRARKNARDGPFGERSPKSNRTPGAYDGFCLRPCCRNLARWRGANCAIPNNLTPH